MEDQIVKGKVLEILVRDFPGFTIDPENKDLSYLVAGDFATYLLQCFQRNESEELQRGLDFIERLQKNGNAEVRKLATIGYLEGIQNYWRNVGVDPEVIYDQLGSESKKWWNQLNKFWRKEINYVGETIDQESLDEGK